MSEASRDQNYVPAALGQSSASSTTTLPFIIDSVTGRLKVDSASGSGDVVGPSSATDNAVVRFDLTTGKLIQNSIVSIDDLGNIAPVTSDTGGLGTATLMWSDLFLASGSVINWNNGNMSLTHSAGLLTVAGGNLGLGTNSLTLTGSIASTISRVTKLWATDVESTNYPTVNGTAIDATFAPKASPTFTGTVTIPTPFTLGAVSVTSTGTQINYLSGATGTTGTTTTNLVFSTSPTLVTPVLGVASATSLATSAATPLKLTNGQLVDIALTGQTVGATTLTIPNFASVVDTFVFITLAQTLSNKTFVAPALGTPASGTLTNCTGLPVAGIAASTVTALGVGSIELGHATDTSLTRSDAGVLAVEGVVIPSISSTNTLTNKRVQPRILSAASYTTDTGTSLNIDNLDVFIVTAQAGALLFNAPGGTLAQAERLVIRIKDNGTARALTWNAVFRAMGTALPSTTVLSKTLYLGFYYNSTDTKWDLVASAQEA